MNISIVDQSKAKEINYYGEMVRLGNEFRNKKDHIINKGTKIEALIPAKTDGFDFETCMESDLKKWLASNKKKSPSQVSFINRVYAWRFNDEHNKQSLKLLAISKLERELINSNLRKESEWLGETGFGGKVTYSLGSLTNDNHRDMAYSS